MRGRIVQTGSKNPTVTQKRSTAGYARFQPLREFQGRGPQGEHIGTPTWFDHHANKAYYAGENWEVPPPDLPSGDQGRLPSYLPPNERYRVNYDQIDWSK